MKHLLAVSALALALTACPKPAPAPPGQEPAPQAQPATPEGQSAQAAPTLSSHYWLLSSATDGKGQAIAALQPDAKRPLRLTLAEGRLSVSGGCNSIGGGYTEKSGTLEVGRLVSTMMACSDQRLMQLDSEISKRLEGTLRAEIGGDDTPQLTLVTAGGDKLVFAGEPTPETRYGSKGETQFLEVASQLVPCSHPLIPDHRCLQVREREYDANGVQKPAKAEWQPLFEGIQGYEHIDGQRDVVRVKRFDWKNPPADASSVVYVLDMVVESEVADAKK
ncbi:META and DUF4377 domain-containing protein [Luteimonas aquatica]|uniref:META and DUF4377 domain-containing protein n=1 Tax=Luteimonas aquatica TaxID=450364 RepID=UPI001F5975D8|nr:META and DUF4377 domain-containing protein [Luteimonas aquatica]